MQLEPGFASRRPAAGPGEILRLFLASAAAYTAAGLLLGLALVVRDAFVAQPVAWSARWLHVHLALAMGVTQAIIGAMQFFASAFLAVTPPARSLIRAQWVLANAGALIMLGGGLTTHLWVIGAGGTLMLAAVVLLFWSLWDMARRSLMGVDLNLLFDLTAVGFVFVGMILGILMALGLTGPLYRPDVRLAHMHFNLLGFVTLTIVGTMHTFFPTMAAVRLYSWRLAAWTYGLLTAGALLMGLGFLLGWMPMVVGGGIAEVAGSAVFLYNLRRTRRAATVLSLPARHLYAAAWFLLISNLAGTELVGGSASAATLAAVTHVALVGFIGQTLLGAMLHLIPVVVGVYGKPGVRGRLQPIIAWGGTAQVWLLNAGVVGYAASAVAAAALPAWATALGRAGLVAALLMGLALILAMGKAVCCFAAART